MAKLMIYTRILAAYSAQYLKTKMAYRADFGVYVFSDLLLQSLNLFFILVVFQHIPDLKGWSREEILFIYGFFLIPFGIYSGFFNHLFDVPEKYVVQGEMDRILVRPLNSLFQVVMETMHLELLLGIIPGLIIMSYAAEALNLTWLWWEYPLGFLMVMGAALIYGGVYTALASLGFWFEGRTGLMPMIYNLSNYGRYPTTIYRGLIRFVLTWILPFAFTGFFPSAVLLHRKEFYSYGLLTPLVGFLFFTLGFWVWHRGINRYQGTGS